MEKNFRGKRLHITVDNSAHHEGGVQKLLVNGKAMASDILADDLIHDGDEITVVM